MQVSALRKELYGGRGLPQGKKNKQQTNKEKYYVFSKNSVYKKIINKLNLLKLLKKYSEAKLL